VTPSNRDRFTCRRCGACCIGDGSVFLLPDDVRAIARHLGIPLQETVDRYTEFLILELRDEQQGYLYLPYLTLRKDEKRACLFLRDKLCSIEPAKPAQCRETPFVEEFFTDAEWRETLRRDCPALRAMPQDRLPRPEDFPGAPLRERAYLDLLREHRYSLEEILGVTLPGPRLVFDTEQDTHAPR